MGRLRPLTLPLLFGPKCFSVFNVCCLYQQVHTRESKAHSQTFPQSLSSSDTPPPRFSTIRSTSRDSCNTAKQTPCCCYSQRDCTVCVPPVRIIFFFIYIKQVPAIQQKRTVAFLNQFVVHTVQFLNRFSTVCEEVGPVILV